MKKSEKKLQKAVVYAASEQDIPFARRVADEARVRFCELRHKRFSNGCIETSMLGSVRGKHVFVVGSIVGDIDKAQAQFYSTIRAAKDSHAKRITAVIGYTATARSDKKDKKYIGWGLDLEAGLLKKAGAKDVVVCDLHNEASAVSYRMNRDVVTARKTLLDYVEKNLNIGVVVAADTGGVKRARKVAEGRLNTLHGVVDKIRSSTEGDDTTSSTGVFGADVRGKNVLVFEDEWATGSTARDAAEHIWQAGAKAVYLVCTHMVACSKRPYAEPIIKAATLYANERIKDLVKRAIFAENLCRLFEDMEPDGDDIVRNADAFTQIISTNTCPMASVKQRMIDAGKLVEIDVAPVFGSAVRNIILDTPFGDLIEYSNGDLNE